MPRGDRITRQLILLRMLLGSRHGATLDQMAEVLPPDSPKHSRTIRRDLEALERADFPLVTDRIDGKTRWKVMEGFRDIPLVSFSAKDLMALTIARGLLLPLKGTVPEIRGQSPSPLFQSPETNFFRVRTFLMAKP